MIKSNNTITCNCSKLGEVTVIQTSEEPETDVESGKSKVNLLFYSAYSADVFFLVGYCYCGAISITHCNHCDY